MIEQGRETLEGLADESDQLAIMWFERGEAEIGESFRNTARVMRVRAYRIFGLTEEEEEASATIQTV